MSKDEIEKTFWTTIVSAVLFIVFGIFLLFKPDTTITIISRCLTAITAFIGIFGLFKYLTRKNKERKFNINIIYSLASFMVALTIYLYPTAISNFVPLVMGIYMEINTFLRLSYLKHLNKYKNKDFGVCLLIFIVMLLLGIILIFNPLRNVLSVNQSLGMLITFYALLDIILCYIFRNNID